MVYGRVVSPKWREVKRALLGRRGWARAGVAGFRGPCPFNVAWRRGDARPRVLEPDAAGGAFMTCRACGSLAGRRTRKHWAALLAGGGDPGAAGARRPAHRRRGGRGWLALGGRGGLAGAGDVVGAGGRAGLPGGAPARGGAPAWRAGRGARGGSGRDGLGRRGVYRGGRTRGGAEWRLRITGRRWKRSGG